MQQLYAPTEDFIRVERGRLAEDVTGGTNVTITLDNNDQFVVGSWVVIGQEGSEIVEMQQVSAKIGATQIQVPILKFSYKSGEPVTRFRFNQRKFYGANAAAGPWTELTADGSPKNIQVDDPMGTLLEYTGNEGFTFFKATYYDSNSGDETTVEDAQATSGDQTKRYASLWAIRKHAGLVGNTYYSDGRIETKRRQAENEINSAISTRYVLPLSEVPALLGQICELLAAGYIDFEEFGKEGEGVKWLAEARALLKHIQNGKQRLIGEDGIELSRNETVGVLNGFPDGSPGAGSPHFTIDQKF